MIIAALSGEINQTISKVLRMLKECGFRVVVVGNLTEVSEQSVLLLGRHPRKKHNGRCDHRRRWGLYRLRDRGVLGVGYAEGAPQDNLWFRDLCDKIEMAGAERTASDRGFLFALESLREHR